VILRSFEKEFNLNRVVSESKSNFTIKKNKLSSLYFSQEKKILLLYFINRQWTVPSVLFLVASPLGVISVTNHRRRLHRWLYSRWLNFHAQHTHGPTQTDPNHPLNLPTPKTSKSTPQNPNLQATREALYHPFPSLSISPKNKKSLPSRNRSRSNGVVSIFYNKKQKLKIKLNLLN
jgi:hypothetical protein